MLEFKKDGWFLKFNEETGEIESLQDKKREYVGEKTAIFKIGVMSRDGEQYQCSMESMSLLNSEIRENGFTAVYADQSMKVTVTAEIEKSISWKIAVDREDQLVTEWVDFPRIAVPNELKDQGGTSKILWGFNEGGIVDNLSYKEKDAFHYRELQYPSISSIPMYPAMVESQFLAYFNEESGLYYGAHDKEDSVKGIDFYELGAGILLQMRHFTGVDFGVRYEMDYPVVMESFEGDWQDAAQIYKKWFQKEKTAGFVQISKNQALPEWYEESPIVITYPVRGRHDGDEMNPNKLFPYMNGLKHIERLGEVLNSKILVLLMHWEGTAPWAPPYVWPPYGGENELKTYIEALHERGDLVGVYCSGMGWTQYSKIVENYNREQEFEEKHLADAMCVSPKQELPYCEIVPNIRAGYDMCPTQKFTKKVLKEQTELMVQADLDYIQLLDQNHGGTSYFCYSQNHGHAPVPGKWQVDAVKELLEEVKTCTGKVLLGCESAAAESYIPYLLFSDNRFQLNYGAGYPVPLYAYLYHEYVNNFMGNQICADLWINYEKSPEGLLERLAYSFAAGDMLTLVLNENGDISWNWGWRNLENVPNQEHVITFVRNANAWRRGIGKKYLHTGVMKKPYEVLCEEALLHGAQGHVFVMPRIHTCAWEAEDGSYGQFLINCRPEDAECEICLPEGEYELIDIKQNMLKISGGKQKIRIEKLSVVLVERKRC